MNYQDVEMRGNRLVNTTAPPDEPSLLVRATELLRHIASLEEEHARTSETLFGPVPKAENEAKPLGQSIEYLLASACSHAASLVGDSRTLNNRLNDTRKSQSGVTLDR